MSAEARPPLRVLVVEDDAGTAAALTAFLDALEGVEAIGTAGNGAEGLERIRDERPDLVLLDLVMPRMDGLELLERLRSELRPEERPYIIVLSGVSGDVTVQRALRLGAAFYMVKPVNLAALEKRIHDRLGRSGGTERGREALARWHLEEMGGGALAGAGLLCTAAAALAERDGAMLKVAYAEVRRVHGVEYVNAEQAIRRCIRALHRADSPAYRALMGGGPPGARPPGNGEFLRRLAEKLRGQ